MRTNKIALVSFAALTLAASTLSIGCHPAAHDDATTVDDLRAQDASTIEDSAAQDRVAPDASATIARPFEHGAVLHEGGAWLVLATREDDPSEGDFHAVDTSSGNQALTRAVRDDVAREISAPVAVRVYRGSEWVCDANASATPVVLAIVDPGFDDQGERAQKPLDEVWTSGLRVIASPLTATRGDCARGEWAQRIDRAAPTFATEHPASNAIVAEAVRVLRASEQGQVIERAHVAQCAEEHLCDRAWSDRPDVARTVRLWTFADGRRVVYAAVHGTEGCGGFNAEIAMIAEITEQNGSLRFASTTVTDAPSFDPTVLLERVDDGQRVLEWRFAADRLWLDAAREWKFERVTIPYFGCPC